ALRALPSPAAARRFGRCRRGGGGRPAGDPSAHEALFDAWCAEHGKAYVPEERAARLAVFADNAALVAAHNARAQRLRGPDARRVPRRAPRPPRGRPGGGDAKERRRARVWGPRWRRRRCARRGGLEEERGRHQGQGPGQLRSLLELFRYRCYGRNKQNQDRHTDGTCNKNKNRRKL
ncbi:unnamed protein product, partial [Urochloa humidicola]